MRLLFDAKAHMHNLLLNQACAKIGIGRVLLH